MSADRGELLDRLRVIRAARIQLTLTIHRPATYNSSTGVTNVLEFLNSLNEFLRDTFRQLEFPAPAADRIVGFLTQLGYSESPPDFFGFIRHGLHWRGPPSATPLRSFSLRD